jgi:ribonuclease-3
LRHRSRVHEQTAAGEAERDNEALEFLGDAVLGFLLSEFLVRQFPDEVEGALSKRKAHYASAVHLDGVARSLDIGPHLSLGRGEEMSGGRSKRTLLVDALEALIAAVYLDGGLEAARKLVIGRVIGASETGVLPDAPPTPADHKSALQEMAQRRKLPQPRYAIVAERGPEHAKTFVVEARVGQETLGRGEGNSKKLAAQRAAREAMEQLSARSEFPG